MNKSLFTLVFLFLIITLCGYKCFSQSQARKQACFSGKQIDLNANNLPPNYHGNDLYGLMKEQSRRAYLTKDEFETTAQFLERVEKEKKKPLLGELNSDSIFAFEISDTKFLYDADKQLMSAELILARILAWKSPCNTEQINVLLFRDFENSVAIPMNFNADIAKAKRIKPNLRTLLIYALRSEVCEIWLYDISTGEIFLKQKTDLKKIREEIKKKLESEQEGNKGDQRDKHKRQVEVAKSFYEKGDDDAASAELRKILASEPMNAEAYLLLGKIHFRRKDLEQAASSLKTALFWDDKLIEAHILLGKTYLQRGNCSWAKTYSSSALAVDSENQDAKDLQKQVEKCSR